MEKYCIDDVYVGELYFSYPIRNKKVPSSLHEYSKKGKEKYQSVVKRGAIDLQGFLGDKYIDIKNDRYYDVFLTVFFECSNHVYLCLHDKREYVHKGVDFCNHLVPIRTFLPQMGCQLPEKLTSLQAEILFDKLFKKSYSFDYDNTLYDMRRFYIGNLNLYVGREDMMIGDDYYKRYFFDNVGQSYLTYLSDAKLIGGFQLEKVDNHLLKKYYYEIYNCLFLRLRNGILYNLNNYQIYQDGVFSKANYHNVGEEKSFFDELSPLKKELDDYQVSCQKKFISIPNALKLQKRLVHKKQLTDFR